MGSEFVHAPRARRDLCTSLTRSRLATAAQARRPAITSLDEPTR